MAMGEFSVSSSLTADSKVKFAAMPTSWRPPWRQLTFTRWASHRSSHA